MKIQRFFMQSIIVIAITAAIYLFLRVPEFFSIVQPGNSINVLALPNTFDGHCVAAFEKETGVKVYVTYFETYEELMVKMRSGSGDYDLIMGVDYLVDPLTSEKLVKPLDKSKLDFIDRLYPAVKDLYCDPGMQYGLPWAWEIYGIGINIDAFGGQMPEKSWRLLFDKKYAPYRVGMINDAREGIALAAFYLFGSKRVMSSEDLLKIQDLMLAQKEWVILYTDLRNDYLLLSRTCSIVVGLSNDINRAVIADPSIKFFVPEEGSFIGFDIFFIPAGTNKDEMAYRFLNYLYRQDVYKGYVDDFTFMPVLTGIIPPNDPFYMEPTPEFIKTANYFNYIIPEKELHQLWITIKS